MRVAVALLLLVACGSPLGFGEPCVANWDCTSGACRTAEFKTPPAAFRFCTADCGFSAPCSPGSVCLIDSETRALCYQGCVTSADCSPLSKCDPDHGGMFALAGVCTPR